MKKWRVLQLIVTVVTALALGLLSGTFVMNSSFDYGALKKPFFAPPGWLFGVVWTILYLLIGIVFSRGGSTGGTDIIAMIITKYRNISPGRIIMYCDVIIIGSSYFLLHSIDKMVYGFVSMAVVSYTLDAFLSGSNASAQIFIFSPKCEEIANFINNESQRGVTLIDGKGWYTQQDVKILMTIVRKRETSMLFRKIKEIDPTAFISMASVMGVYGKGFEKIKG